MPVARQVLAGGCRRSVCCAVLPGTFFYFLIPRTWHIAWRDFYSHVLALFPRVSMGRPFQEKLADVQWETEALDAHLQAWKDGLTGVPIVDAAMRQARMMGWMHNRVRMVTAMYLVKDLMIDWRLGEKVWAYALRAFSFMLMFLCTVCSTLWRFLLMVTLHLTTAVGSGARAPAWTLRRISEYSIPIRRVRKSVVQTVF